jgi:hypothetical protein
LIAVLPFCLVWNLTGFLNLKRSVLQTGFFVTIVLLSGTLISKTWQVEKLYPVQQILLQDLVGIQIRTQTPWVEKLYPEHPPLNLVYSDSVVPLYCCDGARFSMVRSQDELKQLFHLWFQAVSHEPIAWLRHRSLMFRHLLGWERRAVCLPLFVEVEPNLFGFERSRYFFRDKIDQGLRFVEDSFLFRGWLYLLLLTGLLAFAWKNRKTQPVHFSFLLSGFFYGASYFGLATTCDFRLIWYSVLVSLLGLVLRIAR